MWERFNVPEPVSRLHSWYKSSVSGAEQPTATAEVLCAPSRLDAAAYEAGLDFVAPVVPETIAKSLAIGNPADGIFALDVARETSGGIDAVSEQEITDGIALLAETTGIFTETAGGVTVATLRRLLATGQLDPAAETVLYNTGDGLRMALAIGALPHGSWSATGTSRSTAARSTWPAMP